MNQPWYPQQRSFLRAPGSQPPSHMSLVMAGISSVIFAGCLVISMFDALDYIEVLSQDTVVMLLLRLPCAVAAVIGAILLFAKQISGGYVVVGSVVALYVTFIVTVLLSSNPGSYLGIVFKSQSGRVGYLLLIGVLAAVLSVVPPTRRYIRYAKASASPAPYPQQPWYPPQHGYPQHGYPMQPPRGYPHQGAQPPRW